MSGIGDLNVVARHVMDTNLYMTLGTTEPDARPRVSPVYFTHTGYHDLFWISSPRARHSENIAARPDIAIVIYDSTAPIGLGRAVYIAASAYVVPDADLPWRCAEAFADVAEGTRPYAPHELSGEAGFRLYHAQATRHEVHLPGRDPRNESGIDIRREVSP